MRLGLMRNVPALLGLVLALAPARQPAWAGKGDDAELRRKLTAALGVAPGRIERAPLPGWLVVTFGGHVVLVSEDGRWLMSGALVSLETGRELLGPHRRAARLAAIEDFGEERMIVFPARGEPRHVISVFTDVDCPYCRRFHEEVPRLNAEGVTVRYIPFARFPPGTPGHRKMVSVWCAEDRRKALTDAKAGRAVPQRDCEGQPVDAGVRLGRMLGVSGTPTIFTPAGRVIPGYVPAAELLARLRAESSPPPRRRSGSVQ